MKHRKLWIAPITLALILASGCATGAQNGEVNPAESDSDQPFVIGIATASSGWMAADDEPAERAARLAVEDINAAGGINGRMLEVKHVDTQTDQSIAATAAQQLIADGADVILASADFDYGSPSALVAQAEDVVTISVGAASPLFGHEGIGDLAFTVGTLTPTLAAGGAEWAFSEGLQKAIAFCDVSIEYSVSLCESFKESFTAVGGEVVAVENFQQDDASIAQQATRMQSEQADFIYIASYLPGGASAVRQIRAAGIDLPIVSGAALEGAEWLASVPGLSDFYFTAVRFIHGNGAESEILEFLQKYEAEYGVLPERADAVLGYVAVELIVQALEENGGDASGVTLAAALDSLTDSKTSIGPVTFADGQGFQLQRELSVIEVENQEMKFLKRITPQHVSVPTF